MALTKIQIKNVTYYAYHGIMPIERNLGGKYQVDLDIWYDASTAIKSDNISDTINYQEVLYVISDIILNETFHLIEALGNEIIVCIMRKFDLIEKCTIRIRKLCAPINQYLDYIEVEQTIERNLFLFKE